MIFYSVSFGLRGLGLFGLVLEEGWIGLNLIILVWVVLYSRKYLDFGVEILVLCVGCIILDFYFRVFMRIKRCIVMVRKFVLFFFEI